MTGQLEPVLVLGGRERHALAIVRALGREGIPTYTADDHSFCTSGLSRYCKGQFIYPSPEKTPHDFIAFLRRLLTTKHFSMVFAVTDVIPILLSRHKTELSKLATILVPDWDIFQQANNKCLTFKIARKANVPMPNTFIIKTVPDLERILPQLTYPAVLKPVSKTIIDDKRGAFSLKATYANDGRELEKLFSLVAQEGLEFLVQEFIPGAGGYGVGILCDKGAVRASFAFKRLHEYPITGGASTLRVGIDYPEMTHIAERLMQALAWDGVAMVEFKVDARDNIPKLIEVNGRFWGSLALAIYSGVNFPYLLYKQSRQEPLPPFEAHNGRKVRWLIPGDILYFIEALQSRKNIFPIVKDFFAFRGISDDVLSLSDPLPVIGEIKVSLSYLVEVLLGQRSIHGELRKSKNR